MQTRQIIGPLVLLLLALPHPLWAQSLETRKMRAEQEAALGTQVALTNTKCGTNMTARIDWNTFDEAEVLTQRVLRGARRPSTPSRIFVATRWAKRPSCPR